MYVELADYRHLGYGVVLGTPVQSCFFSGRGAGKARKFKDPPGTGFVNRLSTGDNYFVFSIF